MFTSEKNKILKMEKGQNFKTIPLQKNKKDVKQTAKCSEKHFDTIKQYNWWIGNDGYAETYYKGEKIILYKFIVNVLEGLKTPKGHFIDIINRDRLDYRLENLRFLTKAQSSRNKTKKEDASSTKYGVKFDKKSQKFKARVKYNDIETHLGYYKTEEEAAIAYDTYIFQKDLKKEGYNLNYPDKEEFYKTNTIFKKKEKSSNYNGVTFYKKQKKYRAQISKAEKPIFTFWSFNEIVCAEKYDDYIVANNLNKKLNFPNRHPAYKPLIIRNIKVPIDDKYCKIVSKSGKETIIDNHMYDKIKYHKIYISEYVRIIVNHQTFLLHRFLTDTYEDGILVDHSDGDPYNNRLENLVRTDYTGNAINVKKVKKEGSTICLNVLKTKSGKFQTKFDNKVLKYTRTHDTEEHAARDRDLQIIKNASNSNYKKHFNDWNEEEIAKWENILENTRKRRKIKK